MSENPFSIDRQCLNIIVWIGNLISRRPISDFQVKNVLSGFVNKVIGVSCACRKTNAHTGRKQNALVIRLQSRLSLQDVHKLILFRMGVAQGGNRIGLQTGDIDAVVSQSKKVAQLSFLSTLNARCKRLWIK